MEETARSTCDSIHCGFQTSSDEVSPPSSTRRTPRTPSFTDGFVVSGHNKYLQASVDYEVAAVSSDNKYN